LLAEFSDPRLVAIYQTVNAYAPGTQPDFYSALAAEVDATTIVDVGCGTGLITRELARQGYQMIGIDPAPAMIDVARRSDHGEMVKWICGDVSEIGWPRADLAMMSGHVAQFFLTDEEWSDALRALHAALRPDGYVAFESRNPDALEWELWIRDERKTVDDPVAGPIETWSERTALDAGIVSYINHYVFVATGDDVVVSSRLRFRSLDELTRSLIVAGFAVERVYGDWDRRPASRTARELIVVARRVEVDT
jgi:SAM-dependent methyltransferase